MFEFLEDFDVNPVALALGLVGGIVSIFVIGKVQVNIIFKILSFIASTIVCYLVASKIGNSG